MPKRNSSVIASRMATASTRAAIPCAYEVEIVEYQGRDYAVEVRTTGGRTLHVRSDHAPEVGTKVLLTVDPSRALVYQEDLDTATTVAHDTAVPA
ncbi:TOBE domain-containing protein [Brachybacterium alimentarium]|uniref:TOBE domain-containing protein n=1 Tax=Brachybacterium alimentarium TaxID=47845 RepID=UPI003FD29015